MKDILDEIIATKRAEIIKQKKNISHNALEKNLDEYLSAKSGFPAHIPISMKNRLANSTTGIIAEFKRKSPSKGWIKKGGKAEYIPLAYETNGASALSILTDTHYFGGNIKFIQTARPLVKLPILRKDFIIDEYQLLEARLIGADAVLLIASALTIEECTTLATKARELGLETLLEIHSPDELIYTQTPIDMIGVNNRNLGTFHTDIQNSFTLAEKLPKDTLLVSESGISDIDTLKELRSVGFKGFLIGETFMKEKNPGLALHKFIQQLS